MVKIVQSCYWAPLPCPTGEHDHTLEELFEEALDKYIGDESTAQVQKMAAWYAERARDILREECNYRIDEALAGEDI